MINVYKILVQEPDRKKQFGRNRLGEGANIKIDLEANSVRMWNGFTDVIMLSSERLLCMTL
jgi:hypothetical protein